MNSVATNITAISIIPSIVYQDVQAAIEWLCTAFGFSKQLVVAAEQGKIVHAQLILGDCMIMTGSPRTDDNPYGRLVRVPAEVGNFVTQSTYIVLDDKDMESHYKHALQHGATMIRALKEEDYGGKGYTCRDIEGHIWSFGSYDPFEEVKPY